MNFYFKMPKTLNLTNAEIATYASIAYYAASSGKCFATRETLCKRSGTFKEDTITKHTNKLVKEGFIKKEMKSVGNKRYLTYSIVKPIEYKAVYNDIFNLDISANELGFLIKLSLLSFDNVIKMSKTDLLSKTKSNSTTFNKYIKALENCNALTYKDGIIELSEELFPIFEVNRLSKENQNTAKQILNNPSDTKLYRQVKNFWDKKLYLTTDADKWFRNLLAGFVGKKKLTRNG